MGRRRYCCDFLCGCIGTSGGTATQTNENSATATFEGHQASLGVNAVVDPEAEELPELPDAFGTITQADGVDVAVQGQLVGQVNLSSQRGLAVATAVSGEVVVTKLDDPASGNGIEAISSARLRHQWCRPRRRATRTAQLRSSGAMYGMLRPAPQAKQ